MTCTDLLYSDRIKHFVTIGDKLCGEDGLLTTDCNTLLYRKMRGQENNDVTLQ